MANVVAEFNMSYKVKAENYRPVSPTSVESVTRGDSERQDQSALGTARTI